MLIGECTSDNGVHVHRNAISMCAPALPYVAGCLAVAARPPKRRRRSGAFGRGWERPPRPMAWFGRGALRVFTRWPPPSRGRSRRNIPRGKATERRCERGGSSDRTGLRVSTLAGPPRPGCGPCVPAPSRPPREGDPSPRPPSPDARPEAVRYGRVQRTLAAPRHLLTLLPWHARRLRRSSARPRRGVSLVSGSPTSLASLRFARGFFWATASGRPPPAFAPRAFGMPRSLPRKCHAEGRCIYRSRRNPIPAFPHVLARSIAPASCAKIPQLAARARDRGERLAWLGGEDGIMMPEHHRCCAKGDYLQWTPRHA